MATQRIKPLRQITSNQKNNPPPKTVADLKKKYKHLPLYFLFNIQKEIDHQCPNLDKYLEQLNEIETVLKKIRKCQSLENAKIHAATALHYLATLPDELDETTRGNFEKLRQTANDWKQLAIDAINETKTPEKFLKV